MMPFIVSISIHVSGWVRADNNPGLLPHVITMSGR